MGRSSSCDVHAHITDPNRRAETLMGRFASGFAIHAAFLGKIPKSLRSA
jgi:hypothetical protein